MLGGDLTSEVAAGTPERVDALGTGLAQQVVVMAEQLRRDNRVHVADGAGDGIDMTSRHTPSRQRLLEVRQRRADLLAIIGGARVAAGLAALARQKVSGQFGAALIGELALPARD